MDLVSPRQPTGSLLFAPAEESAPRPLSAFLRHKAISLDMVDPDACPRFSEPSRAGPLEMRTLYGTYGAPAATGELRLRHLVAEFRASEAAKCGCRVSDIAWFYQTAHISVSGTCAWGQSCTKNKERLSLSTTLSSGPCMASYTLLYFYGILERSLVGRALETLEDAVPGVAHLIRFRFSVRWKARTHSATFHHNQTLEVSVLCR